MSSERWQKVWEVFERVVELTPAKRSALLDEACGEDEKLRRGVEEMLAADRQPDSFLDHPVGQRPDGDDETEAHTGGPRRASGTMIGPYRILRRIGQGGMGTVYLAARDDDAYRRRVVVKLVRRGMETEAVLRRLRTERQILASLEHPYIARLYDGGSTEDGLPYFVLEYVEGVPIDAYCDHNRLSVDERLTLLRKVCEAVRYAHQNLVVHRDLKPSNILVTAAGEPKLLDFGIAKLLNPELSSSGLESTDTWHRILTPNYASPEQIRGRLITTASDVYSLGVLLYKLLTGRLPHRFAGRSVEEIESELLDSEPVAPSLAVTRPLEDAGAETVTAADTPAGGTRPAVLRRQLAGDLDAIVLKTLRTAPQRRYGSAERLAADLERYQLGLPVEARAGGWRYRAGKLVRRHRGAVAAAAAVVLMVLGFAAAMALQAERVAFERDQARLERDKKSQVLNLVLELFQAGNPYVIPGEELTVREALVRSVPILNQGLAAQPEVRAELLYTSGSILHRLRRDKEARDPLEEALAIRRRLHGDAHPQVADTMSILAATLAGLGELDRAETLARHAVAIARDAGDDAAPVLCGTLNELVAILCHRSQFEAAEEPAVEALALARRPVVGSVVRQIPALVHLGRVRNAQGDHGEAVKLYREALALRRARYGDQHPAQIVTLNNLAVSLRHMEDLEAAGQAYQQALALQRENFGDENADPRLMNNLAGLYLARGELDAAMELFREAREIIVAGPGPEHWMVFFFDLRIAGTRIRQGATAQAEGDLRRLLEQWRPLLGEHWRMAVGVGLLGESVSAQGRCAESEPLLVESFERLLAKGSPSARNAGFDRLREHFERCGKPQEIARFEAMLEPAAS